MITGHVVMRWDSGETQEIKLLGNVRGLTRLEDNGWISRPRLSGIVLDGGTMTDAEAARLTRWMRDVLMTKK